MGASVIGLSSGALLTIGGYEYKYDEYIKDIWQLKKNSWLLIGRLAKVQIEIE